LRVAIDDVAWLHAATSGDAAAVRRLLDEAGPVVYGYVYARVGGDEQVAADVVQDTFVEAVKSAATFRGDSAVSTWLCAIASRRLARHYEAERRQDEARRGLQVVPVPETERTDEIVERDVVVRALGRLSPDHRQVLVLRYLDGLPVGDVADRLGRSQVQVQSLLQRARNALRVELEAAG
jgi:RNA polymerase sigma-70 factor (ECF subfamily)